MSSPALDEDWVVSIVKTCEPEPFWMFTAVVEEMFWTMPPYQERLNMVAPVVEETLNKSFTVAVPCKVKSPAGVVVPMPTLPSY